MNTSNDIPSEMDRNLLSIGEASEYLGISIDTLRRWEKKGRIEPFRSPGGHRYYNKVDLDNLFGKRYTRDEETHRAGGAYGQDAHQVGGAYGPESIRLTKDEMPNSVSQEKDDKQSLPMPESTQDFVDLNRSTTLTENVVSVSEVKETIQAVGLPSWRSVETIDIKESLTKESTSTLNGSPEPDSQKETPAFDHPRREIKIPETVVVNIFAQKKEITETIVEQPQTDVTSLPRPTEASILNPLNFVPAVPVPVTAVKNESPKVKAKLDPSTKKWIAFLLIMVALVLLTIGWYDLWQKSQLVLSPVP